MDKPISDSHDPTVIYRVLQIISITGLVGLLLLSFFMQDISTEVASSTRLFALVQAVMIAIAIRLYMRSALSKATFWAGIAAFTAPLIGLSGCMMALN